MDLEHEVNELSDKVTQLNRQEQSETTMATRIDDQVYQQRRTNYGLND